LGLVLFYYFNPVSLILNLGPINHNPIATFQKPNTEPEQEGNGHQPNSPIYKQDLPRQQVRKKSGFKSPTETTISESFITNQARTWGCTSHWYKHTIEQFQMPTSEGRLERVQYQKKATK
jgi:hypothetical protein